MGKKRHTRKTMKGGAFSENESMQLLQQGIPDDLVERISNSNIPFDDIMSLIAIVTQGNNHLNENDNNSEDSMSSLHLSDLNDEDDDMANLTSDSGNTTVDDESIGFGGKKRRKRKSKTVKRKHTRKR